MAAFEAFSRALRLDAVNEDSIKNLERLASVTNAWPKLAELYEAEVVKMGDQIQQVEMLLRPGTRLRRGWRLRRRRLRPSVRVPEVESENPTAVLALDRLYERGQHWAELAQILRTEMRVANSTLRSSRCSSDSVSCTKTCVMSTMRSRCIARSRPSDPEPRPDAASLGAVVCGQRSSDRDRGHPGAAASRRGAVGKAGSHPRGAALEKMTDPNERRR